LAKEKLDAPSSAMMRAVMIASAERVPGSPNRTDTGYGYPTLKSWMANSHTVLDYLPIKSGQHLKASFKAPRTQNAHFVLTWLDPPLSSSSVYPYFANLQFVLKDSNGLHRGNGIVDEFTTNAEIVLGTIEGDCELHVVATAFPASPDTINFTIAIRGMKVDLEFAPVNECDPGSKGKWTNGTCVCPAGLAGPLCSDKVQELPAKLQVSQGKNKDLRYFMLKPSAGTKKIAFRVTRGAPVNEYGVQLCLDTQPISRLAESGAACRSTKGAWGSNSMKRPDEKGTVYETTYEATEAFDTLYAATWCAQADVCNYTLEW
jgi:hypothetical protein